MSVMPMQVAELAALTATPEADQSGSLRVLDVRELWEVQLAPMPDAVHIPMGEITSRHAELDPELTWVCVCHHGMRSMQVAMYLQRLGFEHLYNLTGGIDAWSHQVDPSIPRY
jgi:rhodanese-related sulfurtransferase